MLRDAPPQFTDIDSLGVPRPTGAATALMPASHSPSDAHQPCSR